MIGKVLMEIRKSKKKKLENIDRNRDSLSNDVNNNNRNNITDEDKNR